jgi:hypothetical protein
MDGSGDEAFYPSSCLYPPFSNFTMDLRLNLCIFAVCLPVLDFFYPSIRMLLEESAVKNLQQDA